ncbi:helix-turn-helix domain-containing protein [Kitasatospora aureofaciens]|uniref:helix-turn-helix domain-containing protein n=1 Tax=Kitasatospora aureofaciens TaxID=1894 RepID=UPI0033A1FB28
MSLQGSRMYDRDGIVISGESTRQERHLMPHETERSTEWLTVQELATHYRVSTRTVLRWISADTSMRVRRLGPSGRVIRIHVSELNREFATALPAA